MLNQWIDKRPFSFVAVMAIAILLSDWFIASPSEAIDMLFWGIGGFVWSALLAVIWKDVMAVERGGIKSPIDYRYPSLHMAVGTTFSIIPVVINPIFCPILILIPITAYNRISLGRHNLNEVVGGFLIGLTVIFLLKIFELDVAVGVVWICLIALMPLALKH